MYLTPPIYIYTFAGVFQELGRPKCYPYWPQDPGPEHKLVFGDVSIVYCLLCVYRHIQ